MAFNLCNLRGHHKLKSPMYFSHTAKLCPMPKFACLKHQAMCLEPTKLCDGVSDCPDQSDEGRLCGMLNFCIPHLSSLSSSLNHQHHWNIIISPSLHVHCTFFIIILSSKLCHHPYSTFYRYLLYHHCTIIMLSSPLYYHPHCIFFFAITIVSSSSCCEFTAQGQCDILYISLCLPTFI